MVRTIDLDRETRKRFKSITWFADRAGYCVGHRMSGARDLHEASELLTECEYHALASFNAVPDDDWSVGDLGDQGEQIAKRVRLGSLGIVRAWIETIESKPRVLASLGCIIVGNDGNDYIHVVRAELALECADELRALIDQYDAEAEALG